MRSTAVLLTVALVAASGCAPKRPVMHAGHLQVRPLPIDDIMFSAEQIFIGKVTAVRMVKGTVADREVTFRVEFALRGLDKGTRWLTVKQYSELAPVVTKGDYLLWYLPMPSRLGLASPIGLLSGSFRLERDERGLVLAMNDVGNELLWGDGQTLWDIYSKEDVIKALRDNGASEAEISKSVEAGSMLTTPGPVPVDLLVALNGLKRLPAEGVK